MRKNFAQQLLDAVGIEAWDVRSFTIHCEVDKQPVITIERLIPSWGDIDGIDKKTYTVVDITEEDFVPNGTNQNPVD